jgi:hypothetical protein
LDLVLYIPLKEAIYIVELMLIIDILGEFSSKLGVDLGEEV